MKAFAYFNDKALEEKFSSLYNGHYLRPQDKETDELENGIVLPPIRPEGHYHKHTYGVLDNGHRYCIRSSVWENPFTEFSVPADIRHIDKDVIFCGAIYPQYGHFLLEATTRLWYVLEHEAEKPYLCFSSGLNELPWYAKEFFELLNIPLERIILVNQYTRFRKITVPSSSFLWWKHYTDQFLAPFKAIAAAIEPAPYERIYLSRRDPKLPASLFGESDIEAAFVRNGFHPVEFQFMTLREQIAHIKGAKVIAGVNGTALHNIVFSGNKPDVIILNRTEDADTQYLLNDAAEIHACYIVKAYCQPLPVVHGIGPFIIGMTAEMQRFFRDYHLRTGKVTFRPEQHLFRFAAQYYEKYSCLENRQLLEEQHKQTVDAHLAALLILQAYTPPGYALKYRIHLIYMWLRYHLSCGESRKAKKEQYKQIRTLNKLRKQVRTLLWPDRQA